MKIILWSLFTLFFVIPVWGACYYKMLAMIAGVNPIKTKGNKFLSFLLCLFSPFIIAFTYVYCLARIMIDQVVKA